MSYSENKDIGGLRADRERAAAGRFDTDIHADSRIDAIAMHDTFGDAVADRAANGPRSFSVGSGVSDSLSVGAVTGPSSGTSRPGHSALEIAARVSAESDELDGIDTLVADAATAYRAARALLARSEGSIPHDVSALASARALDVTKNDDARDVLDLASDENAREQDEHAGIEETAGCESDRGYAAAKKNRERAEKQVDVQKMRDRARAEGQAVSTTGSKDVPVEEAAGKRTAGARKASGAVDVVALRGAGIDAAMGAISQSEELDGVSSLYYRSKGIRRGAEAFKRAGERARRAVMRQRGSHAASKLAASAKGAGAATVGSETGVALGGLSGGGSGAVGAAAGGGSFLTIVLPVIAGILVIVLLLSIFGNGQDRSVGALDGNEAAIASFLLDKGLDKAHVAAIMGNFSVESGCNPKLVENNSVTQSMGLAGEHDNYPPELININNVGYGIAQWSYWSRSQALVNYAASTSRPSGDIQVQCEFFWIEFNGSVAEFEQIEGLDDATRWFHDVYERSADGEDGMQRRIAEASRIYTAMAQAGNGTDAVSRAYELIGKVAYVWGGCSPGAMDCSGFVSYCLTGEYRRIGTTETFLRWPRADIPLPGDVCVNSVHCGIYVGDGKMIDCGNSGVGQPRSLDPGMVIVRWPG